MRFILPRWFFPTEIGLGELVKKGTAAIGVKPCAACLERAKRLNQVLVLAPVGTGSPVLSPVGGAAAGERTATGGERTAEHKVDHLPHDEGTPESNTERCCTFSVTLTNSRKPKPPWACSWWWPWPQATKVRVSATGATTILYADPDQWQQVSNFPNSVTWDPGTGGPIPLGDPTDFWNIDNDFLLSLGPVSNGLKTITIEWLDANGSVLDAFQASIPCALEDKEPDVEANWEGYTSVTKGGTSVFAYLEPDDCDIGDFDYRAACSITNSTPTCTTNANGDNAYSVTFTGTSGSSGYRWSKDNEAEVATATNIWTAQLTPGQHSIRLRGLDSQGNEVSVCSTEIDLKSPLPDFSSQVDGCTKKVFLSGFLTENPGQVVQWAWVCSNSSIVIPPLMTPPLVDFSIVPDGSYDITLRVKDLYGCWWEQKHSIEVGGCASSWEPKYSWCVEKIDETVHKDVDVTFSSTFGGCAPFNYEWDYGDGTPAGPQATHTYIGAGHGSHYLVMLTVTDSAGCKSVVTHTLTLAQRLMPQFTLKVCPDGKVICETDEPDPDWTASGSPDKAPWPYSKKDKSRVIYRYMSTGTYSVLLTSTNSNGNECESRKFFDFHFDCCAKNTHTRGTSASQSVPLNGTSDLKVIGKLRQLQSHPWHRVIAKTILKKQNSHGKWRRFKSSGVQLEVAFDGIVYRSEEHPLAFDGSYFKGCNCVSPAATSEHKERTSKRKVRVVDGLGGPYRSKIGSLTSHHRITVSGTTYPLLDLSLGKDSDCDHWHWWGDWFFSDH
jgi:hypothetical protein